MSDGIAFLRVIERQPDRVRLAGRMHARDEDEHTFWLDLERDLSGAHVSWILHLDALASTPRKTRDAIITYDHADDIQWTTILTGHAEVRDGALAVISGLTSVHAQYVPPPEPLERAPRDRRRRRRPSRSRRSPGDRDPPSDQEPEPAAGGDGDEQDGETQHY